MVISFCIKTSLNFSVGMLLKLFGGIENFVDTGLSSLSFLLGVLLKARCVNFCPKSYAISPDDFVLLALLVGNFLVEGRALGLSRISLETRLGLALVVYGLGLFSDGFRAFFVLDSPGLAI